MKRDFYDLKDRFLKTAKQRRHMKKVVMPKKDQWKLNRKRLYKKIDNKKDKSLNKRKGKSNKEIDDGNKF